MDIDAFWIASDVTADGSYCTTVTVGDRAWVLTPEQAKDYAAAVYQAVAVAEYDAAVMRLLTERMELDKKTAAQFIGNDLRPDRPPLDPAPTAPLRFEPGVSAFTGKGFVTVHLDGEAVGQLDPDAAKGHAGHALEVAAGVDLDQGLYRALRGTLDLEEGRARAVVESIAEYR